MNRFLKKFLKIFLILFLIFIALATIAFSYFYVNKDKIAETLLLGLNENINGEVSFQDIYLEPFVQFPSVSLALKQFSFYQNPESSRNILEDPIAEFEQVYLAFNVIDLLKDKITITKVLFDDGFFDLIQYPYSKFNFELALGPKKPAIEKKEQDQQATKKVPVKKKKKPTNKIAQVHRVLQLELDKITMKAIYLYYNNQKNGKQTNFYFNDLIASLNITPDSISTKLYVKTEIKKTEISEKLKFYDLEFQFRTDLRYSRKDSTIKVAPSKLILARAEFRLNGMIDLKNDGLIDLKLKASDKKLGFLSLLLTKSGIENLKTGNLFFKGTLKGTLKDEIPELNIGFGIEDLSLKIPGTNDSIKHLNLSGYLNSGKKEDLSAASFKIDSIKAELPHGYIDAVFEMKNFYAPDIKYRLDLSANIDGLDRVFRLRHIDSLQGKIVLHDEFNGVFKKGKKWINEKRGNFMLQFDSVSFKTPGGLFISNLSGTVTDQRNKIQLKKIKFISGNSDFLIDGDVKNLSNLIYDEGEKLIANISLKSELIDMAEILAQDSSVNQSFPYKITRLKLNFTASAIRNELVEFKRMPTLHFKIKNLSAAIDSLLNPFVIKKGNLILSEKEDKILINLNGFDIKSTDNQLLTDFSYSHVKGKAPRISSSIKAKKFNPGNFFWKGLIDSSSAFLNTDISALMKINLRLTKDDEKKIARFEFQADSLSYWDANNSLRFKSLRAYCSGVSYNTDIDKNPLASLSGNIELSTKKLKSKYFEFTDVIYKISANKGTYTISPENDNWFNRKATGKYVISPFHTPPSYSFDYSVKQFSAGELFSNFLEDSVLTGKMDFALRISFKGNHKDSILKTMKGKIRVQGNDLSLHGINVDEFLKKFQTTQELNLLDIGIAVYAGPVALLATKRTNFARIKVTNRKKYSEITNLVSDWKIKNDSLIADDVAFTTENNRIALKGWYSYSADSLDFSIGLLDRKGCAVLKQNFAGMAVKPEMSGMDLFGNFMGSDADDGKKTQSIECKPFYRGSVVQPIENKPLKP